MRILIVNKFLYPNGGSETYIFEVGRQLEKMGHEVQYFGMEHEKNIVGNHAESYTSNMDFHTGKLQKLLYPFRIIYSVEARKKIRIVLDDFKPDVVHLNNFNFQLTPSALYEIKKYQKDTGRNVKIVFTAHDSQLVCPNHLMQQYISHERCTKCIGGSPFNCTKHKCIHGSLAKSFIGSVEASLYRTLGTYRLIDIAICPSKFLKDQLDTCRELQGKTVVMHNFVDAGDVKEHNIDKKNDYVLYFGRYSEEKGIETLLKACRKLPEIPFVFAGNGPLEKDVNELSNITNRGFLSGKELEEAIQNARFSVFPSECNENCPFSVMESITNGTPVIGASIGGVPELINDGQNGYLFESGNEEELCSKINQLWKDEKKLEILAEGCRNTVFYTLEGYCNKLLEYYM
ncbi:MAG: glycosyltransferase family 4 protein [Lachnospiraceae bacterium]|nr:glycosyltransferase family 4 protein [Lachnospiraceae bacterium]MDD7628517.1 glycosyltransferase family 4 protein [Lachnospiraceae bacterium]MDY4120043.1 glycosyltransferase family 4 protein [Lachnospiraceae bacterium]